MSLLTKLQMRFYWTRVLRSTLTRSVRTISMHSSEVDVLSRSKLNLMRSLECWAGLLANIPSCILQTNASVLDLRAWS